MDRSKEKTLNKVMRFETTYRCYEYIKHREISAQIMRVQEEFRQVPNDSYPWENIESGQHWGGNYGYAWFKGTYTVSNELNGKRLWIMSKVGAAEGLLFINGIPRGMFDYTDEVSYECNRLHIIQPLTQNARAGEKFSIGIEAYAGHILHGTMPFDSIGNCDHCYPYSSDRVYEGIYVVEIDEDVQTLLRQLRTLAQLYRKLDSNDYSKWEITNIMEELFAVLPQKPEEYPSEVRKECIRKALAVMTPFFAKKRTDSESIPSFEVGLIGHSHLDTAWLWPVKETIHKAARTFSNALSVMDLYPEYTFIQSSVAHLDWMRKYYPDIFEGIKKRTAEGRWEPNGGSWVECDGNMVGGEYLIRQFVRGQRYLQENLNYHADAFWQPDTFGYSPAIPQIMKGCGMKYFLTTKLSWNDTNIFPYDTFLWKGIDGSEVLTHFNTMHCWPSAEELLEQTRNSIRNKDVSNKKLMAYGFGDGGGGPSYSMVEMARQVENLPCLPKSRHTTVSDFMKELESESKNLPVYDGELYLELHRGTLTQMHHIKRSNRKAEIALHNLELLSVHSNAAKGTPKPEGMAELFDTLYINQFHDILPGTTLAEVHELAIKQNYSVVEKAKQLCSSILSGDGTGLTVYNPLSWEWTRQITVDDNGMVPSEYPWQRYTASDGSHKLVIGNLLIPPFASVSISMIKNDARESNGITPFTINKKRIETPFACISFSNTGEIVSFIDKTAQRELVADSGKPLNTFYMGEDVPWEWDNWDIDYDQRVKMLAQTEMTSFEIVSIGELQCRIRVQRKLGQKSSLCQDIVFYGDDSRIDFETVVDWQDVHSLLKVSFPVDVRTSFARHETQFGYVQRPNNKNTSWDKAKYEVCNHKWTDLSETRYGVAILNDCKYGISVDGNDMRLTLHKGGCHPDPTGDVGEHSFTYSLLPHNCAFCADAVIRSGYELNNPAIAAEGENAALLQSFASVNESNVIIETVKFAEDGNGYILRLYEAEGTATLCSLKLNHSFASITETNMLEDAQQNLSAQNGEIPLHFKPFEIKTIRLSETHSKI